MRSTTTRRNTSIRARVLLATAAVIGAVTISAGPAAADHAHFIYQPAHGNHPATCRYLAAGQTDKAADAPGGHALHTHVHTGQPGTDAHGTAFDKASNAANYDCVWVNTP